MPIDTKERTFEQEIEYWLTSGVKKAERYVKGAPADFNRDFAMDAKVNRPGFSGDSII